ncbi:MAG: rhodanese-like domain-containing protein [Dorea sp.]|jgi:phage shock protein E|nr:rhodanese-like domain-containing protein [Dorea sp.]
MGLFNLFGGADINQGLKEYENTAGAVLLDVRTPQEYKDGHVPGSKNVPLQSIREAKAVISRTDTPVFVYCLSGGRSRQAAGMLERMGYGNVKNIGGISAYKGKVER